MSQQYDYENKNIGDMILFRIFKQGHRQETVALCERVDEAERVIEGLHAIDTVTRLELAKGELERPEDTIRAAFAAS